MPLPGVRLIPEVVSNEELPSAVTLGGLQLNLCGIVGPAVAAVILSHFGASWIFAANAGCFLLVIAAIAQWKRKEKQSRLPLENFFESFVGAIRYVRYAPGIQVVLARNVLFSLFISVIPALLPVIGLKEVLMNSADLGLLFTSMGVGSVFGAIVVIPWARARFSPNALTIFASVLLAIVFVLMAVVRAIPLFMVVAALAGISWTMAASELWVAGQRAMPPWARGRMNATHIMLSQGGMALGGLVWGGYSRFPGREIHPPGRCGVALIELGAGISSFDRFYRKAEFRSCRDRNSIPCHASCAASGGRPGGDHDRFSGRSGESCEIPGADAGGPVDAFAKRSIQLAP